MNGTVSKKGAFEYFFIKGDDGGNYYSQFGWVDASFRDKVEVGARVEFQIRDFQGKPQAFAVRAEAAPTLATTPEPKPFVRTPKADEHKDRRLILLHSILEEGRKLNQEEQKTLFAVWLVNPQGHLLTDSYGCSNCGNHQRFYRERFKNLYVVTFGQDEPAVILCEKCRQRFFQIFRECRTDINPLYDTLEKLGIRPNGHGWNTVAQAASSHRREEIRRQTKPVCKGSEKARQRNAAIVERLSGGWRKIA